MYIKAHLICCSTKLAKPFISRLPCFTVAHRHMLCSWHFYDSDNKWKTASVALFAACSWEPAREIVVRRKRETEIRRTDNDVGRG